MKTKSYTTENFVIISHKQWANANGTQTDGKQEYGHIVRVVINGIEDNHGVWEWECGLQFAKEQASKHSIPLYHGDFQDLRDGNLKNIL